MRATAKEGRTIEGEASQADGHDHGEGDAQVVPVGRVVARPDGPDRLAARKEGSAQHKGPVTVAAIHCPTPFLQALNPKQLLALLYTGSGQASAQV